MRLSDQWSVISVLLCNGHCQCCDQFWSILNKTKILKRLQMLRMYKWDWSVPSPVLIMANIAYSSFIVITKPIVAEEKTWNVLKKQMKGIKTWFKWGWKLIPFYPSSISHGIYSSFIGVALVSWRGKMQKKLCTQNPISTVSPDLLCHQIRFHSGTSILN